MGSGALCLGILHDRNCNRVDGRRWPDLHANNLNLLCPTDGTEDVHIKTITMTRVHYRFIVCLLIFSAALGVFGLNDNYDSYCGKNFAFAQNNCPLLCASGTDQECRNMLGEQYKCFHSTGCSERIKNRGLITHPNSRRTEGEGVCASSLKGAVMGCDYRMACSGDLDCGVAELCYSDICGNPLMILQRYVL